MAQRDVPVHVINEYCHPERSFDPCPEFNERTLPRAATYYSFITHRDEQLFPLVVSDSEGLGVDFSLFRGTLLLRGWPAPTRGAFRDLAAISRLDEVRTAELKQSRDFLEPRSPNHGL